MNWKGWPLLLFVLMITLWSGTLLYFLSASQPLVYDDSFAQMEPVAMKAGSEFRVLRKFTVYRTSHVYLTRTVQQGDCRKTCEVMDISQGYSYLEPGEYFRWRDHKLPARIGKGKWSFIVTIRWEDNLGLAHDIKLKPLEFEVIE